ncbi:hypothetical protein HPP92_009936 [Vanilla planifolia]|uniref:Uncharacterized protein n=1 Tax=Vanilla planifolia TaxID=51239 RepID=A0A835V579_VANPL|nr:hypothetical protein HPP92_009936 [Vanilla planifolia]
MAIIGERRRRRYLGGTVRLGGRRRRRRLAAVRRATQWSRTQWTMVVELLGPAVRKAVMEIAGNFRLMGTNGLLLPVLNSFPLPLP